MKSRISVIATMVLILSLALVLSGCQVPTPPPEQAAEPEAEQAAEPETQMGEPYKIGFAPGVSWASLSATWLRSSPPSWRRQEASLSGQMG